MKLCFPEKVLLQHLVMLGKTGAGKSSALRHVVEFLLIKNKRVVIIDPKGDWWGIKASGDGKSMGFPVIALGNFKEEKATDVPINDRSGKHVAEVITAGNRPCVIGFRGWMPAQMTRFWIDFASTLFNSNGGELYLVIDEVHNFAPKGKVLSPEAGMCLHWTNRIMAEGRGVGIVGLIASQRPQKVHNDTLTCCETLVAMRVNHAADRTALKEWIDGCGDDTHGKEVLANVANLARGEAYIWSPEIHFGPERVKFPMFETFDSFAPPQLQKKVTSSGWADVDLGQFQNKLAASIEEAKANDPKELKAEIRRLNSLLVAKPAPVAPSKPEVLKVPFLSDEDSRKIEHFADLIQSVDKGLTELIHRVKPAVPSPATPRMPTQFAIRPAAIKPISRPRIETSPDQPVQIGSGGKRRLLIALAQYPEGMAARRLSILSGISSTSGTWRNYLAELRGANYVQGGSDHMRITEEGRSALGDFEPLPTGQDLRQYWCHRLGSGGKRRIFETVVAAYPHSLSYEQVGEATGISPLSGTWRNYLAELRGLELLEGRSELKACDDLFHE